MAQSKLRIEPRGRTERRVGVHSDAIWRMSGSAEKRLQIDRTPANCAEARLEHEVRRRILCDHNLVSPRLFLTSTVSNAFHYGYVRRNACQCLVQLAASG